MGRGFFFFPSPYLPAAVLLRPFVFVCVLTPTPPSGPDACLQVPRPEGLRKYASGFLPRVRGGSSVRCRR